MGKDNKGRFLLTHYANNSPQRNYYLYDVDSVIGAATSSDRNPFHSLSHNGRMLYTTNTNTWTFVEDKFLLASECPDDYPSKNVFSKGIYYWLPQSEFGSIALAFDMSSESFKEIPTPDIDTKNQCGELALQNDDVTLFIVDEDLSQINIWVLIVDESIWTKKNSISRIQGVRKSLGFWRKEEELFLVIDHSRGTQASDGQTVLYNSTSGEIRNIGPKGWVECFEALVYYESLVSLNSGITKMKANHAMICYWLNTDSRDGAERN